VENQPLEKLGAADEEIASVAAAKAILAGWLHEDAKPSRSAGTHLSPGLHPASGRDIVHQRPPTRLRQVDLAPPLARGRRRPAKNGHPRIHGHRGAPEVGG
jgi:hypothetical protein